jgi:hypothetical protein
MEDVENTQNYKNPNVYDMNSEMYITVKEFEFL